MRSKKKCVRCWKMREGQRRESCWKCVLEEFIYLFATVWWDQSRSLSPSPVESCWHFLQRLSVCAPHKPDSPQKHNVIDIVPMLKWREEALLSYQWCQDSSGKRDRSFLKLIRSRWLYSMAMANWLPSGLYQCRRTFMTSVTENW